MAMEGYVMVISVAAIEAIPTDLFEAADVMERVHCKRLGVF